MNLSSLSRLVIALGLVAVTTGVYAKDTSLKSALTFYASFDNGTDADLATGDKRLYTLVDKKPKAGNHTENLTQLAKGKGLTGDALLFTKRNAKWLFYDGAKNFEFKEKSWSGTLSFWMKVDPINGLDPGYVDPIQVTPFTWNNASFFVDFNKDGNPRSFRLGAFADKPVWNPENKDVPEPQRPPPRRQNTTGAVTVAGGASWKGAAAQVTHGEAWSRLNRCWPRLPTDGTRLPSGRRTGARH